MQSNTQTQTQIERSFIPLSEPHITGNEWEYVKSCLDDNWVSSAGGFVDRFERMMADYVGADYAVATVNGTAALHTALMVAGVRPDDEVLVSSLTFIAPANAIRYAGAWPVFVDAEANYWQMDVELAIDFIEKNCRYSNGLLYNKATGRRVKAIVPVHVLGHPVDLKPLLEVARKYDLTVIEDASESLGARYQGQSVGTFGDMACFSFNGNKLITTGGGGMVVTSNPEYAQKAKYLTNQAKDDPLEYVHNEIGYNYRLTNLQAAVGCAQLEQINKYVEAKRNIASTYENFLSGVDGIEVMPSAEWADSAYWLYTVLINRDEFGMDSRSLLRDLSHQGVQTRPLWQPIHLSAAHAGAQALNYGVAERLYRDALSLPCSVGLSQPDLFHVIGKIRDLRSGAGETL